MANVHSYASKETMIDALRWDGGDVEFKKVSRWTDGRVRKSGTDLVLQSPGKTEVVRLGDFIVCMNPVSYYSYTPEEFRELYAQVEGM